ILVLGIVVGRWLAPGTEQRIAPVSATKEDVTWTCSMHPDIRQPEPGDCPICGMDLIPLESDGHDHNDNAIMLSDNAMKLAGIRTTVVQSADPVKTSRLNAVVESDERRVYSLSSHLSGRVEDLSIDFVGQKVTQGEVIAMVYAPELVSAQKELFEALKIKDEHPEWVEAAKMKLKNWKLSDKQIERIIASGRPEENFPVLADRSGYVTRMHVKRGDYIKQGQAIYEISDLQSVWVMLDVYESDIAWIRQGDSVNITLSSLPGKDFSGSVDYIDPVIDTRTRVAKARVNLGNPDGILKPGMYGTGLVFSHLIDYENFPVVPASSVMWTGKRSIVYVAIDTEKGTDFQLRQVTLGPDLGNRFVVLDGLKPGERIAVEGTFSIDAATQLSGKPSMMNPEGMSFRSAHDHSDMDMEATDISQEDHTTMDMSTALTAMSISDEAKTALAVVYDRYLDLKDALVADKSGKARKELLKFKKELEAVDMALFGDAAHRLFMSERETMLAHIPEKKKLSDIERSRAAFEYVSNGMITLAKAFLPQEGTFYVQHCPMAFNNKGADWISREHDIRNPYFGSSMLTCGDVTDTLGTK
ncbi:MAG: efflux RND transporter periplasmic adaptor subunit, partial [FCB group bacterium]|nr:efflux RND transporter periplasmic adaptor subunit [FCB group bacterium]